MLHQKLRASIDSIGSDCALDHDPIELNRIAAWMFCRSQISAENRHPLFGIMLQSERMPMLPDALRHSLLKRSLVVLPLLMLPCCTSIGDLGLVQQPAVADNIHGWVGREAAARAGGPISFSNLTDDERTLRDLAFPLIEAPYDRQRWDAVIFEYGQTREYRRSLWVINPEDYYAHLQAANYRSTAGRYNRLNDDIRDDVVRIPPFFDMAHRVIEADRKRQAAMQTLTDISAAERFNALARVSENNLTIAWVEASLAHRAAGYRFALNRLMVSEPESLATTVDISLSLLQQNIGANQLVPVPPQFAAVPVEVAATPPPIVK
jgi:hypothetical protein